ncbi:unnamed protein product [Amoebophrya sp. A25]|nr:unnamed protein product [Amoebophrya sp. A25]|eukprot:GSA25T00004149001.1
MLQYCAAGFREMDEICARAYLMCPQFVPEGFRRDRDFVLWQLDTYIADPHGSLMNIKGYTFSRETEAQIIESFVGDEEVLDTAREAAQRRDEVEAAGGPSRMLYPPDRQRTGILRYFCYPPDE